MIKIYTLSSTRDLNNIRYVGKTKRSLQKRFKDHMNCAKSNLKNNYTKNYNYNWINKEIADGYEIVITLLDEIPYTNNWKWLEIYWISQMKSWGFNLCNLTDGGDGNNNQIFSKESFIKRSLSLKGRKRPPEVCKRISKSKIGISISERHKNNVRNSIISLQGKKINQYDCYGNFIKTWNYIKEAADFYKIEASNIIKCCNRHPDHNFCNKFIWRYVDDKLPIIYGVRYLHQYDLNKNLIRLWVTASEAAKYGYNPSMISYCIKGKKQNYKDSIWEYKINI